MERGIWRSCWCVVPGDRWLHESVDFQTFQEQQLDILNERDRPVANDQSEKHGSNIGPANTIYRAADPSANNILVLALRASNWHSVQENSTVATRDGYDLASDVNLPQMHTHGYALRTGAAHHHHPRPPSDTLALAGQHMQRRRSQRIKERYPSNELDGNDYPGTAMLRSERSGNNRGTRTSVSTVGRKASRITKQNRWPPIGKSRIRPLFPN